MDFFVFPQHRTRQMGSFLPKVGIKHYNVIVDWQNIFDPPVKKGLRTYENVQEITIGQEDDCTIGCLLDYTFSKENYKSIAIELSKQWVLDTHPKATKKISFTGNLNWPGQTTMFFIIEDVKKTV